MTYTRKTLIDLAERSVVPHKFWSNRDSSAAQRQVGEALALLRSDCRFDVLTDPAQATCTDDKTVWLEIHYRGFNQFEGESGSESETFYLPTDNRLKEANGRDWY